MIVIQSHHSKVPFKATNTWSSRLLCIAPHQPTGNKGYVMDDPVAPFFPHSNGSSSNLSVSQSGSSIAERCVFTVFMLPWLPLSDVSFSLGPSPTPSLPQKPSPVVYRINRTGSFQQADRWQQWNGVQLRRTETAPAEATRNDTRTPHNNTSPDYVPSIGQLDMDVDSYFRRSSNVSSHDDLSVTTTDTVDSVAGQSSGDIVDHVPLPNVVVEQECGTENGADVASQSSVTDHKR